MQTDLSGPGLPFQPAEQPDLERHYATVAGMRMFYHASPVSTRSFHPPVVLVHGLGVSSRYMLPTARRLAGEFRVYAPDLPGFGRSTHPARVLNVPELADVLVGWLAEIGLEKVSLVANSLGCQVVVDLAARYPQLVERLVLTGPTIDPANRNIPSQLGRLLLDTPREPFSQILIAVEDYLRCGPRRMIRTLQHALADRIETKLPLIQAHTLVVRGEYDTLAPEGWAEKATGLLPHGRLAVIPDAPHALPNGAAPQLTALLRPFLTDN